MAVSGGCISPDLRHCTADTHVDVQENSRRSLDVDDTSRGEPVYVLHSYSEGIYVQGKAITEMHGVVSSLIDAPHSRSTPHSVLFLFVFSS